MVFNKGSERHFPRFKETLKTLPWRWFNEGNCNLKIKNKTSLKSFFLVDSIIVLIIII